jgi:hypothetical protein
MDLILLLDGSLATVMKIIDIFIINKTSELWNLSKDIF